MRFPTAQEARSYSMEESETLARFFSEVVELARRRVHHFRFYGKLDVEEVDLIRGFGYTIQWNQYLECYEVSY